MLFDGQRVWSFNPDRDGAPSSVAGRAVGWPKALERHLDGVARSSWSATPPDEVLHTRASPSVRAPGASASNDRDGHPLAVDKGGRLQRDFSNTETSAREEVMDALEQVLHDLRSECDLDAYLMYGCLLGAVRDGHMIGHDSDADVAYLSKHHHPFDIIRECTDATRRMRALGWQVVRMSGANFKVWVPLPDGRRCGIDVFGSFHIGDRFFVTGSLTGTLDRSALLPFGTVTLEGREIVAPAKPEEVLAFTYGPDWRIPDPAFHFSHDPADVRRMSAWFRSSRRQLRLLAGLLQESRLRACPHRTVALRRMGAATAHRARRGAGTRPRRRLRHRPRRGVLRAPGPPRRSAGLHERRPQAHPAAAQPERGIEVTRRALNLEDLRSVLITGARLAHEPGVRHIYARGLLDTLGPTGRDNFWRFASMAQRRGGETFVEFRDPSLAPRGQVLRTAPADLRAPGPRGRGDRGVRRPGGAPRGRARPGPARPGEPAHLSTRREVEAVNQRASIRDRITDRLLKFLRATREGDVATTSASHHLHARVTALEAAVEESRQLSQRLADVVDVLTEVLVPALDRDDARLERALRDLNANLDPPSTRASD